MTSDISYFVFQERWTEVKNRNWTFLVENDSLSFYFYEQVSAILSTAVVLSGCCDASFIYSFIFGDSCCSYKSPGVFVSPFRTSTVREGFISIECLVICHWGQNVKRRKSWRGLNCFQINHHVNLCTHLGINSRNHVLIKTLSCQFTYSKKIPHE